MRKLLALSDFWRELQTEYVHQIEDNEELLQTDVRDVALNVRKALSHEISQNQITQAASSQTFSIKEKIVSDGIRGKDL